MAKKGLKNKKAVTAWLCAALLLLTVGTGATVAIIFGNGVENVFTNSNQKPSSTSSPTVPSAPPSSQPSSGTPSQEQPEGETPVPVEKKPLPEELRAVTLKAGRELLEGGSPEEQQAKIDAAMSAALALTMNSVVIDSKGLVPQDGFDPLRYAVESAQGQGLYTFVHFYVTDIMTNEKPQPLGSFDATLLDNLFASITEFSARCSTPDGVILDGYYNVSTPQDYVRYLKAGTGMGYSSYHQGIPDALVTLCAQTFEKLLPSAHIGLISEPVWANAVENQLGSNTKGNFSTLTDGHTDTLAILEKGLCDFIAVKAPGSTDDPALPYGAVSSWWATQTQSLQIPLFIIHASDKAVTDAVGWGEYDQISRQVIESRKLSGFSGSIFNSLQRLEENPKEFASKLIGYYEGEVKADHILTNLEITSPPQTKTTFTSFDTSITFKGNTDPNTESTINGTLITTDKNGYFALEMPLEVGENKFVITHKGKSITYTITRVIEVVREVTPTGVINVDGATKITVSAIAYREAKVYAIVKGERVDLVFDEESQEDESLRNTPFGKFSGIYTVPDPTTTVQNLGAIVVYGEWGEHKKSKEGATLKINARALPSDGRPVMVTSQWAETFPSNVLSHYSDPNYFPLPKGALDYAVGSEQRYTTTDEKTGKPRTYSFYKLASGLRVFTDDISTVSTTNAPVGNRITGMTVESDTRHTRVTLATKQQVSFTAKYAADAITVQFHYTDSVPESMALTKNPLFSNVTFKGSTMTLSLKNRGVFFGYAAEFDQQGNLILRFNNPPAVSGNDLTGAKIVIDPGHGGNDTGALGYVASHPEKVINYAVASKLANILSSRGAKVVLINSQSTNYTLEERVLMGVAADPHLFVSVHSNSTLGNATAAGTEAYYFTPYSYAMAQHASNYVSSALQTNNRGGKFGYFYVTRNTQFPSVLIETGFVSNRTEYSKLVDATYQSGIATNIANAIGAYFKTMGASRNFPTGTQTSGTMNKGSTTPPPASPSKPTTPSPEEEIEGSDTSSGTATDKLVLNETKMTLYVEEEETLWAEFESGDAAEVQWSASGSSGVVKIVVDKQSPDTVTLQALKPGKITIIAKLKSDPSKSAQCVITVEE